MCIILYKAYLESGLRIELNSLLGYQSALTSII